MVHTTRLRIKGIERSSRRTRYILPRTRKAPCANLLLLPLTETLRTNNDDDDNDNVETHTARYTRLVVSPLLRTRGPSLLRLRCLCHRDTTKPENKQLPSRTRLVCRKARLFFTGRNSLSLRGKRGTQRENEGHTVARARVPTGGNERKREGEREKERETARQNDTIRLRRRSDSNWAPSGWSRPTSADSAEPRRSPIARSFPPSLPIPPIPNPSRRPSLLVLASQPPPSCLLLFPLTNSRALFPRRASPL